MGKWTTVDITPDQLVDSMQDLADTGEQIAAILDAIVTLLEAIAPLLVFPDNPLKALINIIIDAVAGFIDDLLSNNVAVAFHHNMKFDTSWRLTQKAAFKTPYGKEGDAVYYPATSSGFTPNLEDGDIPFTGTGLAGWVGALMSSVRNDADPWAPVQNDDGNCGLFLLVWTAPTLTEFQDLIPLIKDLLFNWDEFKWDQYDKDFWPDNAEARAHWSAMGSAFGAAWSSHTGADEGLSGWEAIKSGYANKVGGALDLPDNFSILNMPQPLWRSIPIARIFGPPLQALLEAFRDFINSLKFPVNDTLKRLVEALARKVERLSQIIAKISRLIDQLAILIEAITSAHFILIPPAKDTTGAGEPFLGNGGINGCFIDALGADDAPDYGPDAVVVGVCGLINMDTGMDNFQTMMTLLNGEIEAFVDGYTEQLDAVTEAWEGVEDAVGDADWNNTPPTVRIPASVSSPVTAVYGYASGTLTVSVNPSGAFSLIVDDESVSVTPGSSPSDTASAIESALGLLSDTRYTAVASSNVVTLTADDRYSPADGDIILYSADSGVVASGSTFTNPSLDMTINLNSTTSDVNDDSLTHLWVLLSVPSGSSLTPGDPSAISSYTSEDATFNPDVIGAYSFRLTVSDGVDDTEDEVTVTIVA